MLYKPRFCCNCGEKIERVDWKLWTSRRFCDVCAIEQKGHDLLPKAAIAAAAMFGIFGIGTYLQGGGVGNSKGNQAGSSFSERKQRFSADVGREGIAPDPQRASTQRDDGKVLSQTTAINPAAVVSGEQPRPQKPASDAPEYFCGAMTKKGKPCLRKVKKPNERCWQHVGQPSAASVRKTPDRGLNSVRNMRDDGDDRNAMAEAVRRRP